MGLGVSRCYYAVASNAGLGIVHIVNPWSRAYGVARTIMATGSAFTLAVNSQSVLFPAGPTCGGVGAAGLFCLVPDTPMWLNTARWLAVIGLLLVASGWRPRFTGVLHWWLSVAVFVNTAPVDGGDHITGVLALILLPATATDPRRWHWAPAPSVPSTPRWQTQMLVGASALLIARIQVAGVYLHAFAAKMAVEEWVDGTALYYWLVDHDFGIQTQLLGGATGILANGTAVVALTWGSILVEILLFLGLVAPQRLRLWLFGVGVGFHLLIGIFMGLWSFSLAMTAALILYLWPTDGSGGRVFSSATDWDTALRVGLARSRRRIGGEELDWKRRNAETEIVGVGRLRAALADHRRCACIGAER